LRNSRRRPLDEAVSGDPLTDDVGSDGGAHRRILLDAMICACRVARRRARESAPCPPLGKDPLLSRYRSPARRSRWPRWVLALLVFAAVLVAADRIALVVAERAAGRTVQIAQHLANAPSVSIGGFPFLTQLAVARFGHVRLAASGLSVGRDGRTIRISRVSADLYGVGFARDLSSVHADTASASAAVSYRDLSATLGVPLRYGGPSPDGVGRITARKSVSIAGQQFAGSATAEVRIADGALSFRAPQVIVDGVGGAAVPPPIIDALAGVFGDPVALTRLPFGLTVRSVTADSQGVHIILVGSDLTFRRS